LPNLLVQEPHPFHALYSAQDWGKAKTASVTGGCDVGHTALFDAQTRERFFQQGRVDLESATLDLHSFQFIKRTEELEFGRGIFFRLGK